MKNRIIILSLACVSLFLSINCARNAAVSKSQNVEKQAFTKVSDVLWASPKGFDLTMDIYTPNTGKKDYPVIVMYHGGGWLINNKQIMWQASEYLSSHGEYVVCNVNYRLLGDLKNTVTLNEIVEDAFGAVLWVKENISKYHGNASKIIVTGDSAGGHLASMVLNNGRNLETDGFEGNTFGFNPSYLPKGETAESIARKDGLKVQAAILSYGAFDMSSFPTSGFETDKNIFWSLGKTKPRGIFENPLGTARRQVFYNQVSPILTIPNVKTQTLPSTLITVGSKDNLTTPALMQDYMTKLKEAGQNNFEYWVHEGRPHAFLDSGKNIFLGIEFEKDAIPALDKMIDYLNHIFY